VAVGAAGRGGHWHRVFILCPGVGEWVWNAADDPDGAVRFPLHPHGGSQHPGLPALRCLLPVPAPAILRVEGPTKMTDAEMRQWLAVTENSRFQWTEDKITSLNGRGALYYFGGEDGIYIRIQPGGELSVGTYKGAFPHIGEALFTRKAVMDCGDFNRAFQKAAQLGGRQFLQDMFSSKPSQEFIEIPAPPGMGMQMM